MNQKIQSSVGFWGRSLVLVQRTLRGLFFRLVKPDDYFAQRTLSSNEYELYIRMDPRERHHGCEVAKTLLKYNPKSSTVLIRAAILHDVGKSFRPFVLWRRILVHIIGTGILPPKPILGGIKGDLQIKVNHPIYGSEMIRKSGGCEQVARLVEIHHDPHGDREAEWLRRADNES